MHIKTSIIGENTKMKLAFIWILRKKFFLLNSNFNFAILFKIAKYKLLHC